jgi:DMSO/TMAO reductase YedYZ molybdopterin-dependent catalytic subunit
MRSVESAKFSDSPLLTPEELQLAARNHSLPLEGLRYDITPAGLHYVLAHFDIPHVDAQTWRLEIGGRVRTPLVLSLDDIRSREPVTMTVVLECAGNGRALLLPRPIGMPWLFEAVGSAQWTGIRLRDLLKDAGLRDDAIEIVFRGADRGVQAAVEHDYERSLATEDALRDDVILAYAMNGAALPPQHGFPLRLVVAGWYGMAHVKWLTHITASDSPFDGVQQNHYRYRESREDRGVPITRMRVRSLMIPPGIPDFLTRTRHVRAGTHVLEGRAWSGSGAISSVVVSTDGGATWSGAKVENGDAPTAWSKWRFEWNAQPGTYELICRATDRTGDTQPLDVDWNVRGIANNVVQRVKTVVR